MTRRQHISEITKRLILLTLFALIIVGGLFGVTLVFGGKLMVSWICFLCGIIGGFVSIQQRLKKISDEELALLSGSWFQILLIPIYGGVFALVLYIAFLGDIIDGSLFPEFQFPELGENKKVSAEYLKLFLSDTYPANGQNFAKLIFWSFVAGFSERFVPQIINDIKK